MRSVRGVLITVLILLLAGVALGEHLQRRTFERSARHAQQARHRLEGEVVGMLGEFEVLKSQLTLEQYRSSMLSSELERRREELEHALTGLNDQGQTIQELRLRVALVQQQVEQLQGELVVVLEGQSPSRADAAIELERVIISNTASAAFQGRVVSVDPSWDFVIVDLGWDHVKIGDMVSIFRNEELLARARIERVQERVAAASVLPEWETTQIQVNDTVKAL